VTDYLRRHRNGLFAALVDAAIANGEIAQTLRRAHGIDAAYLRERCMQSSVELWGEVSETAADYDEATRRAGELARLNPLAHAAREVLTSTRRQYICALGGVLAVMSAWFVYDPGPSEVHPRYSLLIAAVTVVAIALVTRAPLGDSVILRSDHARRVTDVVVVPVLTAAGIVMFLLAVVRLGGQQAGTAKQWFEAWAIIFGLSLVAVPVMRTVREAAPGRAFYSREMRSVVIFIISVFGLLVSIFSILRELPLFFGKPDSALLYGGLGAVALSALIALLGFPLRPVRLLRQELRAAERRVTLQLIDVAILPFLRGEINKHTQVLDHEIDVRTAPGLGQVSDPAYLVSTAAAEKVERLFASMPGGSIGLAGPRGAGKTTLMESYCGGPRQLTGSLTTMVSATVEYAPREFLLHLYAKVCRGIIGTHSDVDGLDLVAAVRRRRVPAPWAFGALSIVCGALLIVMHNADVRIPGQVAWALALILAGVVLVGTRSGGRPRAVRASGRELRDLAADRLAEIRFQQSFSSTWSGAVKVPLGFDATVGGGRGLTRQPLHLPEIVDSLREFLALAAREHRVVIGIDELDKMESEAAAEQFLNQVKSVFGVRGCYFLVSVSEDAMSSFERRGLPFRDVFDSTFDEIVWFEHLTAAESIASVDRRVLLMPTPFKQLC
jgi:hypothetical protein